jgi:hypothetical protein
LVTSCLPCNQGKGRTPLSDLVLLTKIKVGPTCNRVTFKAVPHSAPVSGQNGAVKIRVLGVLPPLFATASS